jgi:hypothetical protein
LFFLTFFKRKQNQNGTICSSERKNYALLYTNTHENATRREAPLCSCDPSVGLARVDRYACVSSDRFALIYLAVEAQRFPKAAYMLRGIHGIALAEITLQLYDTFIVLLP